MLKNKKTSNDYGGFDEILLYTYFSDNYIALNMVLKVELGRIAAVVFSTLG